jgi:CheY-like chemotaxis protein
MDFSMPVVDGLASTAAIHDKFPEVEIVAFTSSDDPALARRCSMPAPVAISPSPTSTPCSTTSPGSEQKPRGSTALIAGIAVLITVCELCHGLVDSAAA